MRNICFIFVFLFCTHFDGYGQIPKITIWAPEDKLDSVSPHIFSGTFCIDSIYEMGSAYLITVSSVDSIETHSSLMSSLTGAGVQFTIISFKNGTRSNEKAIRKGEMYYFTLSPPGGIWTLFDHHYDDWGYSQSVQDPMGATIKVPLPLIQTQLMLSSELTGLQYDPHNESQQPSDKSLLR